MAAAAPAREPSPSSGAGLRGAGNRDHTLLVRMRPGVTETTSRALFAAAGATEIGRLDPLGVRVLAVPPGLSRSAVGAALRENAGVLSVELDGSGSITLEPNDNLWYEQWSERKVRAPLAWDVTIGGGPIIAILDTGVKRDHVDLSGRVMDGRDFVNDDLGAGDDNGHGTMVAGVAASRGNNERGVAGTCWGCRILPVKVANRSGNIRWSNAAAGIVWATNKGADVINMSFGSYTSSSTLKSAVEYAISHGVVVVASAGNKGTRTRFYPAAYAGVLSVASTNSSDRLYDWSSRGDWVKIAAPGCTWTTKRGGGWGGFCGTSASAPLVAGVAGLIRSHKPGASALRVREAIRSTAVYFTWRINGGRIDAWAALKDFD